MGVARSTGVLHGTSESSLTTLASGATTTGSEVDVLGDDASAGEMELYAVVAFGSVTSGASNAGVNLKFNKRRLTGEAYTHQVAPVASTTVKVPLGRISAARFMTVTMQNLDGSNGVDLMVGYELTKLT